MSEFMLSVTDLNERVFLEQALTWHREMRTVCRDAPDGLGFGADRVGRARWRTRVGAAEF